MNLDPRKWKLRSDARIIAGEYVKRREASSSNVRPTVVDKRVFDGRSFTSFLLVSNATSLVHKGERERDGGRKLSLGTSKLDRAPGKFVPDRWRTTYRNSSSKCTRSNGDGFLNFPDLSVNWNSSVDTSDGPV